MQAARVIVCDPPCQTEIPWTPEVSLEWFSGFCDGECNLSISGHAGNLQPRFRLNQRDDDGDLIRAIHGLIGIGSLNQRYHSSSTYHPGGAAKPQVVLCVVGTDCRRLVQVFDSHPLRSKKRFEYLVWRDAVEIYASMQSSRWTPEITNKRCELLAPLKSRLEELKKYRGKT